MGFFDFIGKVVDTFVSVGKAICTFVVDLITNNRTNQNQLQYHQDPIPPQMQYYGNPNYANYNQYPTSQHYYVPNYVRSVPNNYAYGYESYQPTTQMIPQQRYPNVNWGNYRIPKSQYPSYAQNMSTSQELKWCESPDLQMRLYGKIINPLPPTDNNGYSITTTENNWNDIWNSNKQAKNNEIVSAFSPRL